MIKQSTQQKLYNQSVLKWLETNDYLTDEKNENFMYIKNKFFFWEVVDKVKLLNVGSDIFKTIARTYSSYIGTPQSLNIVDSLEEFSRDLVSVWLCVFLIEKENNEWKLSYAPARSYVKEDGIDKLYIMYYDENTKKSYVLIQSFYSWYVDNNLYQTTTIGATTSFVSVPLITLEATQWLEERIQTWLNVPNIFVCKDPNGSLIKDIKASVYAVDRHIVMSHTQYIQNVESYVLFKNIRWPHAAMEQHDGGVKINFNAIGRYHNGSEDSWIEFVKNKNDMIDTAIKDNENFVRRIGAAVSIPDEFLWLQTREGAIGEGSRTLRHWAFIKAVIAYRNIFDKIFKQIKEVLKNEEQYNWPQIIPKTDKEMMDEIVLARKEKLMSWQNAIMKYNDYDEDEAKLEMATIEAEWTITPLADDKKKDGDTVS